VTRAGDAALLEAARAAARGAAALLRDARPEQIREMGHPRDLVTEWDLRAEDLIRDELARRAPGIPILGEERGESGGGDAGASAERWLIDPIDGTVNFAHGLPIWGVSIALAREGVPVVGVVVAPALGWWFEATLGGGARDEAGASLAPSAQDRLDRAMLSTGFPYDRATSPDNNFAEWEHLQRVAGACRRLGAASIDLCLVARGWLDGYWERRLRPWDLAAGTLIVAEAGGIVTNTRGGALALQEGEVCATNGAIHQELLAELARVRRPAS
jgi:myo-inositol-1(or 4)-monophosphatase